MIKPLPWLITMRKDTYHKRLELEEKVKELKQTINDLKNESDILDKMRMVQIRKLERENQALRGRVIVLREQLAKERT